MKAMRKSSTARLLGTASLAMILGATSAMADIRFWTTEYQPERLEKQQEMADAFEEETGIAVEVIPITAEAGLQSRITAAFAAGDMPDVVYHPQQFALPWVEAGILDAEAATEVVEALGSDTFAPAGLSLVSTEDGYAAVPVDGWTQMIVYRRDLFEEKGLAPPTDFAAVEAALEALHNHPERFGFVARCIHMNAIAIGSLPWRSAHGPIQEAPRTVRHVRNLNGQH